MQEIKTLPPGRAAATLRDAEGSDGALAPLDAFLRLLAKAIRNFRLYPSDSAHRVQAIAACHEAHTALRGSDRLVCRVTPCELLVDHVSIGAGTII